MADAKEKFLTKNYDLIIKPYNGDDDFDHLFNKADKAVYEAKESGRNKVISHTNT